MSDRLILSRRWALSLAAVLVAAVGPAARADEHGARTPPLPLYQQECGSCHVAFPARGLPAASWQRLMSTLPRHFGTDASLEPALAAPIGQYLQANASRRADNPPEDRVTRSAWFLREHDEIGAAVWRRPAVRSASNCAACHGGAAQGRFSEHDVRIPR